METQNKTALDIIQELIAIHTTRKDVVEKLSAKQEQKDQSVLMPAKEQSDRFTTELLTELSTFGDAVQDSSDRDNEYQQIWKNELNNIDSMQPQDAAVIFDKLENALKHIYDTVMETKELPDSLVEVLSSQKEELQ